MNSPQENMDEFDKNLKQKLGRSEFAFDHKHWESAQKMIQKRKKKRGAFWWMFSIGALGLAITLFFYSSNYQNKNLQVAEETKEKIRRDSIVLSNSSALQAKMLPPTQKLEPQISDFKHRAPQVKNQNHPNTTTIKFDDYPQKNVFNLDYLSITEVTKKSDSTKAASSLPDSMLHNLDTISDSKYDSTKVAHRLLYKFEGYHSLGLGYMQSVHGNGLQLNYGFALKRKKYTIKTIASYDHLFPRNISRQYESIVYGLGYTKHNILIEPKQLGYFNLSVNIIKPIRWNLNNNYFAGINMSYLIYSKSKVTESVQTESGISTHQYMLNNRFTSLRRASLMAQAGFLFDGQGISICLYYLQSLTPYYDWDAKKKYLMSLNLQLNFHLHWAKK